MKKTFKFFLIGSAVLIVTTLLAGLILTQIDPNSFKGFIAGRIKAQTGRDIHLNGDIQLAFYPWIDLQINDAVIDNAPGFEAPAFARVDTLQVRLKTLPLIRKQLIMDKLKVTGLALHLSRDEHGNTNWSGLAGTPGTKPGTGPETTDTPPAGGTSAAAAAMLGGIDIRGAALVWEDRLQGTRVEVSNLDITTGDVVLGQPVDFRLSCDAKADRPQVAGSVAARTTLTYDTASDHYTLDPFNLELRVKGKNLPDASALLTLAAALQMNLADDVITIGNLSFDGLDTRAEGHIRAQGTRSGNPAVAAGVKIDGKDLAVLFRAAEIEPLAGHLAGLADRRFNLAADLDLDPAKGRVTVTDLALKLLGSDISGHLIAERIYSRTPAINGQINARGPDLPSLAMVAGQIGGHAGVKALGSRLSRLKNKKFDIAAQFDADLEAGNAKIPDLRMAALGITADAALTADHIRSQTPEFSGTLSAAGPDLPLLLELAGYFEKPENSTMGGLGRRLADAGNKQFKLKLGYDVDMKNGLIHIPELSAAALGVAVSGTLKGENVDRADGSMDGTLNLQGRHLKKVLHAFGPTPLTDHLSSLSFSTGIRGNLTKIHLAPVSLAAVLSGKQLRNPSETVTLKTDTGISIGGQALEIGSLAVTGLGLDLTGTLSARDVLKAPRYSGRIAAAPFNPRDLAARLKLPLPKTRDPGVLKKAALAADFDGSATGLKIKQAGLVLDETSILGEFTLENFQNPGIRFDLKADTLNLDRYLPREQQQTGSTAAKKKSPAAPSASQTAAGPAAAPPEAVPLALLKSNAAEGHLQIRDLTVSRARMTDAALTLTAGDGRLRLSPVSAALYEGSLRSDIVVDVTGTIPHIKLNARLTNIQAEPLLNDVAGKAKLKGKGDVSADLTASGLTLASLKKQLNGNMSFRFQDGAIVGFNMGRFLRQLKSLKSNLSYTVSDREETDFAELSGNPVITRGVVRLDDLDGKSPALRIQGQGVLANLIEDRIDYLAGVTVVETSKGQSGKSLSELNGITIPVRIRGALDNPGIEPDIQEAVRSLARDQFRDQLDNKIHDALQKLFE